MTSITTNLKLAEPHTPGNDLIDARVRGYQARIESVLEAALPSATQVPQRLHAAQRYAVLGGGKRLRPLLVYRTGEALGCTAGRSDAPAAAVELIHAYSLVHDDLPAMDDDDLRRGRPTTHRASMKPPRSWRATPCRCSPFRCSRMISAAASTPAARLQCVQILAEASGTAGMAGGQAFDWRAVGRQLRLEDLETMHGGRRVH